MTEINEKDLEKASGGLDFSLPGERDLSGKGRPTDPNGCCSLFMFQNEDSERKCKDCCYIGQDFLTREYFCTNKSAK